MGLYVIKANENTYKIGVTGNIKKRMAALQTSHYTKLEVLKFIEFNKKDSFRIEKKLHSVYSEQRLINEWFNLTDKQYASILSYLWLEMMCANLIQIPK